MATTQKCISANDVKNGAATIRVGSAVIAKADAFKNLTNNDAVISDALDTSIADDRFDDPRYYTGDAIT